MYISSARLIAVEAKYNRKLIRQAEFKGMTNNTTVKLIDIEHSNTKQLKSILFFCLGDPSLHRIHPVFGHLGRVRLLPPWLPASGWLLPTRGPRHHDQCLLPARGRGAQADRHHSHSLSSSQHGHNSSGWS